MKVKSFAIRIGACAIEVACAGCRILETGYGDDNVVVRTSTDAVSSATGAVKSTVAWAGASILSFADDMGVAQLTVPDPHLDSTYTISVTAQGYKPYLQACTSGNVAISEAAASDIVVSPNPASNATSVSASGLRCVALINVMGQTLQTVAAQGDRCTVSLDAIPAGLYLLRIEAASGTTVRKLVVN